MEITGMGLRLQKIIADNSPIIMTGIGIAGTLATAYFSGKAAVKADRIIRQTETFNLPGDQMELTKMDKVKLTWKIFIPPVSVGALTIASIVGSNRVSTRRHAALAVAYSLSERAFVEYSDKVLDRIGEKKELEIRDDIARDQVALNPPTNIDIIVTGLGNDLCYEALTGRYFLSSIEVLRRAQNDLNFQILNSHYASLGDFYEKIRLPQTQYSEEIGWNADNKVDLKFATVLTEQQHPCVSFKYRAEPIRGHNKLF